MIKIANKIKKIFQRDLKIHKSCDSIFKYNYDKILETEDLRWLVKNFNDDSKLKLKQYEIVALNNVWISIFEESIKLKGDHNVIKNIRKRASIANLKNRLFWGTTIIKTISKNPNSKNLKKLVEQLNKWKFIFDINKSVETQIDAVIKQLKSLRTRINIEVSKYEKTLEKYKKQEKKNVQDQVRAVEKILDLKYPLNIKEITQSQWISYVKDAENVIKQQRKGNG